MNDNDIEQQLPPLRTRIVCTIGPATDDEELIGEMIDAGMSVARLNLAHGSRADHERYIAKIRKAEEGRDIEVGILADLPGPKYRLGEMTVPAIHLNEGAEFILRKNPIDGTQHEASINPPGLYKDIVSGARVLINEGVVELIAEEVKDGDIHCRVSIGGEIQRHKSVTAPGFTSTLGYFTDETMAALDMAANAEIDFVGLSYIRNTDDLRAVRSFLKERGFTPDLVAKIELRQAVENIERIVEEADAIMVARGDLGVEMPLQDVPGVQKRIIAVSNHAGKPVITATQMLESMIGAPRPSRAEVTDVHNAVVDGTDAIMLSAETSVGKYPLRAVRFMAAIARSAEEQTDYSRIAARRSLGPAMVDDTIAASASRVAEELGAVAIIAFTESGSTAKRVATFRPSVPIIAPVRRLEALRTLTLCWGIRPILSKPYTEVQSIFRAGSEIAVSMGYAKEGDLIVIVAGIPIGVPGNTNLLRVIRVPAID